MGSPTNMGVISWRMKKFWDAEMAPHWMKYMTLHYGAVSAKAPSDEQCRLACRCLGKRLAEWTATYVHGIASAHPSLKLAERRPPHG